jgi:L-histidine N-alpha-methyltransferase
MRLRESDSSLVVEFGREEIPLNRKGTMTSSLVSKTSELTIENRLKQRSQRQISIDVMAGLTADPRSVPSKYFYDAHGSRLFEDICALPEYYLTRVEMSLLRDKARQLIDGFEDGDLVELGSGANWKIRTLLEAMGKSRRSSTRYVPMDVSETALVTAGKELRAVYPELDVAGIVADFTKDLHRIESGRPKLVLFLGSTIGNLNELESRMFLQSVAKFLGSGDRLLLGMDMVKTKDVLEAAYNDSQGVTAEFNKNILFVLNRELEADFDPEDFEHLAFFNEEDERMEMHLRANRTLSVRIAGLDLTVDFDEGQTIRTEICRKFRRSTANKMVEEAGMKIAKWLTDPKNWFSIVEVVADN